MQLYGFTYSYTYNLQAIENEYSSNHFTMGRVRWNIFNHSKSKLNSEFSFSQADYLISIILC